MGVVIFELLGLLLFALVVWLTIFQILIPAFNGRKLFPAFNQSPLKERVEKEREEVIETAEAVKNLQQLNLLAKSRKELEDQLRALDEAAASQQSTTPPTNKE